ncbi:hypothetical protein GCM10010360_59550 [Streptomyces nogalater]
MDSRPPPLALSRGPRPGSRTRRGAVRLGRHGGQRYLPGEFARKALAGRGRAHRPGARGVAGRGAADGDAVVEEVPAETAATAVRAAVSPRAVGAVADVVCGWWAPTDGRPLAPGPCAARYRPASDCRASRCRGAVRKVRAPERPSCEG